VPLLAATSSTATDDTASAVDVEVGNSRESRRALPGGIFRGETVGDGVGMDHLQGFEILILWT